MDAAAWARGASGARTSVWAGDDTTRQTTELRHGVWPSPPWSPPRAANERTSSCPGCSPARARRAGQGASPPNSPMAPSRMCRACDWLVGQFAHGQLEPRVRAARPGRCLPARLHEGARIRGCIGDRRRGAAAGPGRLLNAVLRRVAGVVEAGPVVWPDLGTRLSYPDWVITRLGEDIGPERAMAALEQMNVAASPSVRADGYVQDPGSQAVAEYMVGLLLPEESPGRGTRRVCGPGWQDHAWSLVALHLWWGPTWRPSASGPAGRQRPPPRARQRGRRGRRRFGPPISTVQLRRRAGRRALHAAWACSAGGQTPAGGAVPRTSGA